MVIPPRRMVKRKSWNSDRSIGPKQEFSAYQILTIEQYLLRDQQWHDLALLSLGLDSLLRGGDLIRLKVHDVIWPDGNVRKKIDARQQKTKRGVFPTLTKATLPPGDALPRIVTVNHHASVTSPS